MKGGKRNLFLLWLSLFVIAAFSVAPAMAHDTGDDSPDHSVSASECEYNEAGDRVLSVEAFPPEQVSSFAEEDLVTWEPVLYRWDGVRYHVWKQYERAIAYAHVNTDGFKEGRNLGWRDAKTDESFGSIDFTNLPAGAFLVMNVITWESDGHVHREVSPSWCGN
ncbi:hypothetical protein [Planococcus sp. SSTMD024]|uniref:hypothetical protein n=1 Tax=Planococcus sp. SSTMD024 TaxID=3242163 RepID=UPI00351EB7A7